MNTLTRRTLSTAAVVASVAGAGLGLAPSAQAATSPFIAATSARVPAGWTAVETATSAATSGNTSVVYAVSPTGAQRAVLQLPRTEQVESVSGNGSRIAVNAPGRGMTRVTKVYDLAAHRVTTLPFQGPARFTNPTGTNLYTWSKDYGSEPMVKVDLNGHVTARYPGINNLAVVGSTNGVLVWGMHDGHITLNNNATGKLLRTFAVPRGATGCIPQHDWDATSVAAVCTSGGTAESPAQVYQFHTNGAVTPLTGKLTTKFGGWSVAWHSSAGLVAQAVGGCNPYNPVLQTGSGLRNLPVKAAVDVMGSTALGLTSSACMPTTGSFVRVDLPSMKVHNLLTPAKGRAIVVAVTNDPALGSI